MSEEYLQSEEFKEFLKERREYNLPRLKKLKEMIDSGEVPRCSKDFFVSNDLWERHGFVFCLGVECPKKKTATKNECPLDQSDCWWVYAHRWLEENDKNIKNRLSFMRKYSDI